MQKGFNKRLFKGAIALFAAILIAAVVFFVLAATKVIDENPFKIGFAILTLGAGAVFFIYGLVVKGGYETAVGSILLTIGTIIILTGVLQWWAIVIIAAAMMLLALLLLLFMKGDVLVPERTDEKPDYKPYSETLAEKKERQKEEEAKPLPEIKSYSDKD